MDQPKHHVARLDIGGDHIAVLCPPPFCTDEQTWIEWGFDNFSNDWLGFEYKRLFPDSTYHPFAWENGLDHDLPYLLDLFAKHGWTHYASTAKLDSEGNGSFYLFFVAGSTTTELPQPKRKPEHDL